MPPVFPRHLLFSQKAEVGFVNEMGCLERVFRALHPELAGRNRQNPQRAPTRPTWQSPKPSACTISVALEIRETIRTPLI
jgi:hypothetical protein